MLLLSICQRSVSGLGRISERDTGCSFGSGKSKIASVGGIDAVTRDPLLIVDLRNCEIGVGLPLRLIEISICNRNRILPLFVGIIDCFSLVLFDVGNRSGIMPVCKSRIGLAFILFLGIGRRSSA